MLIFHRRTNSISTSLLLGLPLGGTSVATHLLRIDEERRIGGAQHHCLNVMANNGAVQFFLTSSDDGRMPNNSTKPPLWAERSNNDMEDSNILDWKQRGGYHSPETTFPATSSARGREEASEMRKSCDYCVIRKKKCDGDDTRSCRLVVWEVK